MLKHEGGQLFMRQVFFVGDKAGPITLKLKSCISLYLNKLQRHKTFLVELHVDLFR